MRLVTAALGESCHLSVIERGKLLVIAREDSPESVRLTIEVGSRFDPEKTASGRLLLAPELESVSARDQTIEGVDDMALRIGSPEAAVHAALAVSWLRSRKGAKDSAAVLAALQSAGKTIHQSLGFES